LPLELNKMTEISNEIVLQIQEAKASYIGKHYHAPDVILVNPYVAAAIKEYKGIDELEDIKSFEGMDIAYIMDNNGEEFRLV
tara:strand:- start:1217 stop:1462 length:246 start_codon:yes stop_codon:yes gene_type:complete